MLAPAHFRFFHTVAILEDQVPDRTKVLDDTLSEIDRVRRHLQEAVAQLATAAGAGADPGGYSLPR